MTGSDECGRLPTLSEPEGRLSANRCPYRRLNIVRGNRFKPLRPVRWPIPSVPPPLQEKTARGSVFSDRNRPSARSEPSFRSRRSSRPSNDSRSALPSVRTRRPHSAVTRRRRQTPRAGSSVTQVVDDFFPGDDERGFTRHAPRSQSARGTRPRRWRAVTDGRSSPNLGSRRLAPATGSRCCHRALEPPRAHDSRDNA